jgi:Domain of unknown function (DUF4062)
LPVARARSRLARWDPPGTIGIEGLRAEVVIRTPDQRLRVFVSSTVGEAGELAEERRAVVRAISALRLTPVLFELGARPYPPRQLYRAYLAQSDIFVGLYWQRYGRVDPGMEISGLEEELQLSEGLPRLLYVTTPAPDREPRLAELLARIKQQASNSCRYFRTPAELGRLVRDDLATPTSGRWSLPCGSGWACTPARESWAGTTTSAWTCTGRPGSPRRATAGRSWSLRPPVTWWPMPCPKGSPSETWAGIGSKTSPCPSTCTTW